MTRVMVILICLISSLTSLIYAQHVKDDSVAYTPIPKTYGLGKKEIRSIDSATVNRRYAYFITTQIGSLVGCTDCTDGKDVTSTYSLINGITVGKKIRVGVGVGFDSYVGWQTIPAFASVNWDVVGNKNRNALFIQLNYGYAKGWIQKSYQAYGYASAEGGRLISPLIGYRIKYHDVNFSFMTGIKWQRVFSFYEYPTWNWVNGEYQPGTNYSTIKQDMSRFMFAVAIGWR
jgi:hypothetical protein